MKKISFRLLLIAFLMSFLFQLKAQDRTQSSNLKDNPKLDKSLSEVADFYDAKITINVKNLNGYSNYSFSEGNKEVKVHIIPKSNVSQLHKDLKKITGVKIISLQDNLITCWVEIAKLKTFANNVNTIALVLPFSSNSEVFSQETKKKPMTKNTDGTTNFAIGKKDSEAEKKKNETGAWWSEERDLYEFNLLKDPATGRIPRDAPMLAANAALKSKDFKPLTLGPNLSVAELTVVPRGPNNLGGRTRALGIDKRNAQIMLAGGVSSGVFRSTNGGTTWSRVAPIGQFHNVTSLAQDTRAGFEDTWYYGTGESVGNSATLGSSYLGNGIWKSTDNGLTWAPLAATVTTLETFSSGFDFVHRITVDPTNGNVYAATGNVISRSTDGGTTWATVLGTLANSRYTDVIVTPTGRLYASFHGADANEGVWTSTTGASGSWTKIAGTISAVRTPATWNAPPTTNPVASFYGRIVMAYAPSNPDVVFFLYWNNTTSSCTGTAAPEAKLFKYVQSTGVFTDLSANLPDEAGCSNGNDPFAVQTGYDLLVAVKPDDENTVFIGGTNLYRSTSGFTNTTATKRIGGYNSPANYALYPNHHPDQHIVVFATGDNTTIYSGNDGGIQKADATAVTVAWTSLNNNYVTYQYYNVDIDPANGSTALMGGAQDNGTTTVQTGSNFSAVFGGDGCGTAIMSYTSPTSFNVVASSQSGNLVRLTGPSLGFSISPTGLVSSAFVTTFNLDQDNTNYLYFAGAAVLYRTRIASTITGGAVSGSATGWEIVPAGLTGNIQSFGSSRNSTYGGAAYTASDANRKLYIGTTNGKVFRLNDPAFATSAAVEISPAIISPATTLGVCSSIAVNPFDDNEIMVTFANYAVRSVFHTLNANAAVPTWTVVEGPATGAVTLGSARASAITKIGSTKTYLVGNSTGLYSTQTLSGATTVWDRVGTNEINYALAANMRLRTSDNRIVLGTHGNGMFELQLAAAVNVSSQPMAVTACAGSDVSFSVVATGITAYKWQVSPDSNPANFVDLTIAPPYSTTNSGATLNITAISNTLNGMYYRCVLTDAFAGTTNSSSALLTVANPIDPTSVMTNSSICVGGSVSLTATCSVGTITWYNVATGGASIGTGSPLMQNPTVNNSIYYASCKAGACESNRVATSPVTIIIIANPTGVATSVTEICSGSSVLLSATCSDAGAVVNWYNASSGGVALGTGSPLSQSPTVNTTYYASCKGSSCESGRVATSLVTVLPNLNTQTLVTQVNLKGTISTADPLYNRPDVFVVGSGVCALAGGAVFNYKTHTFTLSAASTVVASLLTADGGTITPGGADTFLTLYSAFDPANPCANIVGINDDFSGTVFLSKITTASLPAGTYTAVLSSFDPGVSANLPWTYSIAIKTTAAVLALGSPPTMVKVNGVTTPISINNGVSVMLSAACNDGTVTWYDFMTGGIALGTGSLIVYPNMSKSYYASCKNSCSETARVATQMITINAGIDPCVQILSYTYVQAGNPSEALFPLTNGMNIAQRANGTSIIVKPICNSVIVESVDMTITGPSLNFTILQNIEPYALFDNAGNNIYGMVLAPGTYSMTVTGYAQDNRAGGTTYGPVVTTFTVTADPLSISVPTLAGTAFCAGTNVNVSFTTSGTFGGGNQFNVLLSDGNGSFATPQIIGTTNVAGTVVCTIPIMAIGGENYRIKVVSTDPAASGNINGVALKVYPLISNLVSPANDYPVGTATIKAVQTINARNNITGASIIQYKAGNTINMTPGFQVVSLSGSSFKAQIEGCSF